MQRLIETIFFSFLFLFTFVVSVFSVGACVCVFSILLSRLQRRKQRQPGEVDTKIFHQILKTTKEIERVMILTSYQPKPLLESNSTHSLNPHVPPFPFLTVIYSSATQKGKKEIKINNYLHQQVEQ